MTPDSSHESNQARSRLFRRKCTTVEVTMRRGYGDIRTTTINIPDEALAADGFRNSLDEFVRDALDVRMIQVWVSHYVQGKKVTETLFVPVMGWHLLSVNWQVIIEDYVQEKLFNCAENQNAPAEKKRSGPALLSYRKNGHSGNPTRKERLHDWLVRLTAIGSTIFYEHYFFDIAIAMPPVQPPARTSVGEVKAIDSDVDATEATKEYAAMKDGTFRSAIEAGDHKPIQAALRHAEKVVGFVFYHSHEHPSLTSDWTGNLGQKIQAMGFVYDLDTQKNPDLADFCNELYKTTVYIYERPMELK